MPKMKTEIDGLELEFEIREVTPQVAQAWMAKNDHNRNVKKRHKAKLTRAMELEEFRFVGDPVRFSAQGRLLDGQHRLLSIIESGKAQLLLVITGFADDDQQYMDSGAIRSAADQVGLVLQKTQPSVWASVARLIIRWDAEDLLTEELTPAPPEINLFIQEHDDAMQRAGCVRPTRCTPRRAGPRPSRALRTSWRNRSTRCSPWPSGGSSPPARGCTRGCRFSPSETRSCGAGRTSGGGSPRRWQPTSAAGMRPGAAARSTGSRSRAAR